MAILRSQTLRLLFLSNTIITHDVLLAGASTSRFAARGAYVSWTAEDALVLQQNVSCHDSADDQGQRSEQLHEEDQHELDGEDSGHRVDGGRIVERVHNAVDGSDDGEGQGDHSAVQETESIAVETCTREAIEAAVYVECIHDECHCGDK